MPAKPVLAPTSEPGPAPAGRERPSVLLVGGPDVDARLELMHRLSDGFEVGALGSEPSLGAKFAAQGFAYRPYRLSRRIDPFADLGSFVELVLAFRRLRPDVVHAFDTKPGVFACLAARLAGVPVVVGTVTGLGSMYGSNAPAIRLARLTYEALQRLACRASSRTVFQNHDDARYFAASRIASPDKTTVILGSGVATDMYAPGQLAADERAALRAELGIGPEDVVVTMITRVMRSKGVLEFAATAREVRLAHPNARFLLVGPEDDGSLDRLSPTELAELRQAVIWPGARRDIPRVLASSDVFALPSAYREGIPRVLLEAASMGLPLITTDSAGCNETVEDGVNGFLIPVRDQAALTRAVTRLVEQPDLRQRFGRASRQRALERFDLEVIVAQTRGLYELLLGERRPRRAAAP